MNQKIIWYIFLTWFFGNYSSDGSVSYKWQEEGLREARRRVASSEQRLKERFFQERLDLHRDPEEENVGIMDPKKESTQFVSLEVRLKVEAWLKSLPVLRESKKA